MTEQTADMRSFAPEAALPIYSGAQAQRHDAPSRYPQHTCEREETSGWAAAAEPSAAPAPLPPVVAYARAQAQAAPGYARAEEARALASYPAPARSSTPRALQAPPLPQDNVSALPSHLDAMRRSLERDNPLARSMSPRDFETDNLLAWADNIDDQMAQIVDF